MKIILLQDVKSLGKEGDIVNVSDGYARNFVIPQKLGVEANDKNKNDLKLKKQREAKEAAERLADAASIDDSRVFITDSGVSEELRAQVHEEVLRHIPFAEVIHTRAGCTVSNHCGPNCLGILFFRK